MLRHLRSYLIYFLAAFLFVPDFATFLIVWAEEMGGIAPLFILDVALLLGFIALLSFLDDINEVLIDHDRHKQT